MAFIEQRCRRHRRSSGGRWGSRHRRWRASLSSWLLDDIDGVTVGQAGGVVEQSLDSHAVAAVDSVQGQLYWAIASIQYHN